MREYAKERGYHSSLEAMRSAQKSEEVWGYAVDLCGHGKCKTIMKHHVLHAIAQLEKEKENPEREFITKYS
jgi:histone H3/H4